MSEPFLGEIRAFASNFAPRGWAFCDGQILPINQHQSLYSLLGTTYGGDGRTTFALPDLRGRVPIHTGSAGQANRELGNHGGEETHLLSLNEIPGHSHAFLANSEPGTLTGPTSSSPGNTYPAETLVAGRAVTKYSSVSDTDMATTSAIGSDQAHNNMQPSLALNYIIAIQGLFPSRN